jgi:hypothetical protein
VASRELGECQGGPQHREGRDIGRDCQRHFGRVVGADERRNQHRRDQRCGGAASAEHQGAAQLPRSHSGRARLGAQEVDANPVARSHFEDLADRDDKREQTVFGGRQ